MFKSLPYPAHTAAYNAYYHFLSITLNQNIVHLKEQIKNRSWLSRSGILFNLFYKGHFMLIECIHFHIRILKYKFLYSAILPLSENNFAGC